jgi:hypothetical protein
MNECENIVLLNVKDLDMTKFMTIIPLLLLISCKLSFQVVSLKFSSLPALALKFSNNVAFREFIELSSSSS